MSRPDEVAFIVREWAAGEDRALEKRATLACQDLRSLAASRLRRERPTHTVPPTALVNEVFLRLLDGREGVWRDRAHFFAQGRVLSWTGDVGVGLATLRRAQESWGRLGTVKTTLHQARTGLQGELGNRCRRTFNERVR